MPIDIETHATFAFTSLFLLLLPQPAEIRQSLPERSSKVSEAGR